jgi:predicted nucleic acid-binding protein
MSAFRSLKAPAPFVAQGLKPDVCFVALAVRLNSHLINEDLSLHPSEQKSLAGDPESMGTPVKSCPDT